MPDTSTQDSKTATAWQRCGAFLMDYLVLATYFAVASALFFVLRSFAVVSSPAYVTVMEKLRGQAFVFFCFVLPVVCYFACFEASVWQATVGKRWGRLRVVGTDGQRVTLARSCLRSAIKFTPWEIAHTGIWYATGQPFLSPPSLLSWWAWGISVVMALCWFGCLFVGSRRTPYDWIAKTRVVWVPQASGDDRAS